MSRSSRAHFEAEGEFPEDEFYDADWEFVEIQERVNVENAIGDVVANMAKDELAEEQASFERDMAEQEVLRADGNWENEGEKE